MCRASWQGRRSVFRFRGWFPIPGGMVGTRDLQRDHFPQYPFRRFSKIQTAVLKICHFCRFGLQLFAKHKFREVFKMPQSPINIDFFEVIHIFSCRFGRFRSIFHAIVQYSQTNFLLIFRISVRVFSPGLGGWVPCQDLPGISPPLLRNFENLELLQFAISSPDLFPRICCRWSPPGSAICSRIRAALSFLVGSVRPFRLHSLRWCRPGCRPSVSAVSSSFL